jgi:hypothetical protein
MSRAGWVLFWVEAAFIAFWVAVFAGDGDFGAGGLFIAFGLFFMTLGFVSRWIPVLGRLGRALDREPGGMQRLQDSRGHVDAVGGASALLGALAGILVGRIF